MKRLSYKLILFLSIINIVDQTQKSKAIPMPIFICLTRIVYIGYSLPNVQFDEVSLAIDEVNVIRQHYTSQLAD